MNKETTTIWSFEERGNWSTHKGDYLGNCSPKVIRNLLLRYTKEGDLVLDQFLGSGTTAIESLLLKRKVIGIDINRLALNISWYRTKELDGTLSLNVGNAASLKMKDGTIDFICTHPPYRDIIKYSKDIKEDLSLMDKEQYYSVMDKVAKECFRVLKNNKNCAIIIGDIRKKGYIEPLGFNVMNIFIKNNFLLKEIIIKEQHNCSSTNKWIELAEKRNFLLIKHEYIFVFEKSYSR